MRLGRVLFAEFKYFKRFTQRQMLNDHYKMTLKPIVGIKVGNFKKDWYYDENRPWTTNFQNNNAPRHKQQVKKKQILVPPEKWDVYVGDRVQLLAGRDKGKQGLIKMIVKERNWVFVEGLNCKYKTEEILKGVWSCSKKESPLLVTQVQLVDPGDEKPCETEWRFTGDGEKVRVSTRSGRILGTPDSATYIHETNIINPATYAESNKDMKESDLLEITYKPHLKTFEQDCMEKAGIVETRKRAKTYWW